MTRDRLGSLRAARQLGGSSEDDGPIEAEADGLDCEMESFFGEVEGVRADMENIRRVMAEVGLKQSVILSERRCEETLKVQEVALILYCISVPNADKGGGCPKIPNFCGRH